MTRRSSHALSRDGARGTFSSTATERERGTLDESSQKQQRLSSLARAVSERSFRASERAHGDSTTGDSATNDGRNAAKARWGMLSNGEAATQPSVLGSVARKSQSPARRCAVFVSEAWAFESLPRQRASV